MSESFRDDPASPPTVKGLYLILDHRWASRWVLTDILRFAGDQGVQFVQYRHKEGGTHDMFRQALKLRNVAKEYQMQFIVNDRCDVGLAVDANGIHLGQSDLPIGLARDLLGPDRVIGISTHSAKEVMEATAQGADYVGFGPLFPTNTKPNHEPVVGLGGLRTVRQLTSLPIIAIGGITSGVVSEIINAGADGVAVASGILNVNDPYEAIKQFLEPFR